MVVFQVLTEPGGHHELRRGKSQGEILFEAGVKAREPSDRLQHTAVGRRWTTAVGRLRRSHRGDVPPDAPHRSLLSSGHAVHTSTLARWKIGVCAQTGSTELVYKAIAPPTCTLSMVYKRNSIRVRS